MAEIFSFVMFGTRGGGPRFAYEIARLHSRFSTRLQIKIDFYLSRDNDKFEDFTKMSHCYFWSRTGKNFLSRLIYSLLAPVNLFVLAMNIKRSQPVECVFGMFHPWNLVLILYLKIINVNVVHVVHDAVPHPGEGSFILSFLMRSCYLLSNKVIFLSQSVKATFYKNFTEKECRQVNLPPYDFGIKRFVRPAVRTDKKLTILFIGRLLKYKGIDIFVDAIKSNKLFFDKFHIRIVGHGDVSAHEIPQEVYLKNDFVSDDELSTEIESADFVIFPYIEASQSGLLSTVAATGAIPIISSIPGLLLQANGAGIVIGEPTSSNIAKTLEKISCLSIEEIESMSRECMNIFNVIDLESEFYQGMFDAFSSR